MGEVTDADRDAVDAILTNFHWDDSQSWRETTADLVKLVADARAAGAASRDAEIEGLRRELASVKGSLSMLRNALDGANGNCDRLVAESAALREWAEGAERERDHVLGKSEAMHIVISTLSGKAGVSDQRLIEALTEAESCVRAAMRTPDGLAAVRAAAGLAPVGGGEATTAHVWTQEVPTEPGIYWHWNGDSDCAPVPLFVTFSGSTGKHFVMAGQVGLAHAIDCDEYGGWWMRLHEPPTSGRGGAVFKDTSEPDAGGEEQSA